MTLTETLAQTLSPDSFATQARTKLSSAGLPEDYTSFVEDCWSSYANGLLRFLLPGGTPPLGVWNAEGGWGEDWGSWQRRYFVFAYDWQARLLAFDLGRVQDGQPLVSMLDTGTGKALNSRSTFKEFIVSELPAHSSGLLDEPNLKTWISSGGQVPLPHQCVGYKVPLFLGGKDEIENTEISDIDVYVSLQGQLFMAS